MAESNKLKHNWQIIWKDWILIPVIAVPILFSIVILFTRKPLFDWYDVSVGGTVGDAIGGITAPFINLLGAILVYVAFKAQNRANRAQWIAIERESRVETFRQIEALLQEVSKEVDSLELSFEEKIWVLHANTNTNMYVTNGTNKIGRSTLAIDYASKLLSNHKLWNLLHIDPKGKVQSYFVFDPQHLYHLFNKLKYIQVSLKVVATLLSTIDRYKSDPIYVRSQAFYSTKLGASLMVFAEALSDAGEEYKAKSEDFIQNQAFIDTFFDGHKKIDSTVLTIVDNQKKYFWKVLGH